MHLIPKGRGTLEDLYDSLGLVKGVKSVEPQTNGAIAWAEPVVNLKDLNKAAEDVKFTVKILSHQQITFTYEKKKDDADLDALLTVEDIREVAAESVIGIERFLDIFRRCDGAFDILIEKKAEVVQRQQNAEYGR